MSIPEKPIYLEYVQLLKSTLLESYSTMVLGYNWAESLMKSWIQI